MDMETALALVMLVRVEEAVSLLQQRELAKPWRLGKLYLTSCVRCWRASARKAWQ